MLSPFLLLAAVVLAAEVKNMSWKCPVENGDPIMCFDSLFENALLNINSDSCGQRTAKSHASDISFNMANSTDHSWTMALDAHPKCKPFNFTNDMSMRADAIIKESLACRLDLLSLGSLLSDALELDRRHQSCMERYISSLSNPTNKTERD